MNDKQKNNRIPQNSIKLFLIKLVLASIVFVIVVNLLFNLMFAERLEKVDKILMLNKSMHRNEMKEKIRNELTDGLKKEQMIAEEDKILMYKIYLKIKKEFENLDKSKI
tara:strand:+ start:3208 stop:3534 length:327 start_codon:yes stop_codon:yes gene_type:complete